MPHGLHDFWEIAIAPAVATLRPRAILLAGGADARLAAALLDAGAADAALLHWAEPPATGDVPPLRRAAGDRLILHRAPAAAAAALFPLADLVLLEGEPSWRATTATLHALRAQAARASRALPLILLGQVAGAGARRDPGAADTDTAVPREGVLTALEDFVRAEAPRCVFADLPLLDGMAILADAEQAASPAVAGLLAAVALGPAARAAAALTTAAADQARAETAALRAELAAAHHRNEALHAALRQEQARPAEAVAAAEPARGLSRLFQRGGRRSEEPAPAPPPPPPPDPVAEAIARLRATPILDAAWYAAQYGDPAAAGIDAAEHYFRYGAAAGRDPGPEFRTDFYLSRYEDVARAGVNPLVHYLVAGAQEGRDPSPAFSTRFYSDSNPDVTGAGNNPLEHFLLHGRAEGRRPLPTR